MPTTQSVRLLQPRLWQSVYSRRKSTTIELPSIASAADKSKFQSSDSYTRLRSQIEVAAYQESSVKHSERLAYPLPLENRGAQEELAYALEPLLGHVGTGSTPGQAIGGKFDQLRLDNQLPPTERIDGTLSALGIGGRTLVAFGGSSSSGTLASADPLVCDAVLRRWATLRVGSSGGSSGSASAGTAAPGAAGSGLPAGSAARAVIHFADDVVDGPFGPGHGGDDDDDSGGEGADGGLTEYLKGYPPPARSHAACARHRHGTAVMGQRLTLLAICGGEGAAGGDVGGPLTLLGDLRILEMRSKEDSDAAAKRRQLRAARAEMFEQLLTLRRRQAYLRSSLEQARAMAAQWEELFEDADAAADLPNEGRAERRALQELRAECQKLRAAARELDAAVATQLRTLNEHGGGADASEWRWCHVEHENRTAALPSTAGGAAAHAAAPPVRSDDAVAAAAAASGDWAFFPRRRHACAAVQSELYIFGGEMHPAHAAANAARRGLFPTGKARTGGAGAAATGGAGAVGVATVGEAAGQPVLASASASAPPMAELADGTQDPAGPRQTAPPLQWWERYAPAELLADRTREPTPPIEFSGPVRRRPSKSWDYDPTAPLSIASEILRAAARIEAQPDDEIMSRLTSVKDASELEAAARANIMRRGHTARRADAPGGGDGGGGAASTLAATTAATTAAAAAATAVGPGGGGRQGGMARSSSSTLTARAAASGERLMRGSASAAAIVRPRLTVSVDGAHAAEDVVEGADEAPLAAAALPAAAPMPAHAHVHAKEEGGAASDEAVNEGADESMMREQRRLGGSGHHLLPTDELLCATLLRGSVADTAGGGKAKAGATAPVIRVRWRRVVASGRAPSARYGHAMCVAGGRLLVHGGVGMQQSVELNGSGAAILKLRPQDYKPFRPEPARVVLGDLHIFDPVRALWSTPELSGWPAAKRAFHALAPLDGRILCFGGVSGGGRFDVADEAATLRLTERTKAGGEGFWTHPHVADASDNTPELRRSHAGSAVVQGQLLLLGGLDETGSSCTDLLSVDVGACALLSVAPCACPVSGGVELRLLGRNLLLPERAAASVRFEWYDRGGEHGGHGGDGGGHGGGGGRHGGGGMARAEVAATVEASDLAKCVVPYVEDRICEGEVSVSVCFKLPAVAQGVAPQVLSTAPIDLLLVGETSPGKCLLCGAGASRAVAGAVTTVRIQACNRRGLPRKNGGDAMSIEIREVRPPTPDDADDEAEAAPPELPPRKPVPPHLAKQKSAPAGVAVTPEAGEGAKAAAATKPGMRRAKTTTALTAGVAGEGGAAGAPAPSDAAGSSGAGKPPGPTEYQLSMVDHKSGRYTCTYTAPEACGMYEITLRVNGEAGPTQALLVVPGVAHPAMIELSLTPADGAVAGEPLHVAIQPHDVHGNPCALDPSKLLASLHAPRLQPPLVDIEEEEAERRDREEADAADAADEDNTDDDDEQEEKQGTGGADADDAQGGIALGESAVTPAPRSVSFLTEPPSERWPVGDAGAAAAGGAARNAGSAAARGALHAGQLRVWPQTTEYGPLSCRIHPKAAGEYTLAVELVGSRAAAQRKASQSPRKRAKAHNAHVARFAVAPAATSAAHCILVELPGEKGLCRMASPPREFLLPRDKGYDITVILRDRFGNRRPRGGDEVLATFALHAYGNSTLARRLKLKIAPLEPEPPKVVDRGDGSVAVHLPGTRPCRPPRPFVTPYVEDAPNKLSTTKWLGKLVRKQGTGFDQLALVEDVQYNQISARWVHSGVRMRGQPEVLLGGVDERTIVSDWLSGPIEAKNLDTVDIKGLDQGDKKDRERDPSAPAPLMYLVDNGQQIFRMPVHQLLQAIEARRLEVAEMNAQESISGEYLVGISVNGERALSEVIKIINPFAMGPGSKQAGAFGGGKGSAAAASRRVDWTRDWALCARSLKYRDIEVDPGVEAVLVPYVPLLQDVYTMIADRRARWQAEDEARAAAEAARKEEELTQAIEACADDALEGAIADIFAELAPTALDDVAWEMAVKKVTQGKNAAGAEAAPAGEETAPAAAPGDALSGAPEASAAPGGAAPAPAPALAPAPLPASAAAANLSAPGTPASSVAVAAPSAAGGGGLARLAGAGGKKSKAPAALLALEDFWELCKNWKLTTSGDKGSGRPALTQALIDDLLPTHFASASNLPPAMRRDDSSASSLAGGGGAFATFDSGSSFSSRFSSGTVQLNASESAAPDGGADMGSARLDGSATMSFASFLEGLMVASLARWRGEPLATTVEKLLGEHIKRYGVDYQGKPTDVTGDPFRDELRHGAACREVLREQWEQLLELYRFWAGHSLADDDDEYAEPSGKLTCKDALAMLTKASIIGKKVSLVTARGYLLLVLFEQRMTGFSNADHGDLVLTYGDFVELLARCAKELLKAERGLTLAEQLKAIIDHTFKTTTLPPSTSLPPLVFEKKAPASSDATDATGHAPMMAGGASSMTTPNMA